MNQVRERPYGWGAPDGSRGSVRHASLAPVRYRLRGPTPRGPTARRVTPRGAMLRGPNPRGANPCGAGRPIRRRTAPLAVAALAATLALLGTGAGPAVAAVPPTGAHGPAARVPAQQDGDEQEGGQQEDGEQEDGEQGDGQQGGAGDDLASDGTGKMCERDPRDHEDLRAGWAADFMQIDQLHQEVPSLGEGVTVAVLDTGNWGAPQLSETETLTPIDLTTGSPRRVTDKEGFTWDCDGHGTGVAGLIAARPGDEIDGVNSDMAGVAPGVTLLTVRVTVGRDQGTGEDLATGIREAVDAGADIVNVSIEMGTPYRPLQEAVAYAQQHGVLIVAAAGNSGDVAYPAGFAKEYENVISVGAIGRNGSITEFSSPSAVTVAAPGKNVVTTARNLGHVTEEGTSFAAPLVTGVAALLLDQAGGELAPSDVRDRLMATADPVSGEGADSEYAGAGAVNPVSALTAIVNEQAAEANPEVQEFAGTYVPPPPDHTARNIALGVAGGAVAASTVALVGLATVRRGRKRGWRPGGF